MKKIIAVFLLILFQSSIVSADSSKDINRIIIGNKDAKISIIAYESLTCSHCANFHINVLPDLKKISSIKVLQRLNLDIFH